MDISAGVIVREGDVVRRGPIQVFKLHKNTLDFNRGIMFRMINVYPAVNLNIIVLSREEI